MDVLVVPTRFRCDGPHQGCEYELEGVLDLLICRFAGRKLVALPRDTEIAIWLCPAKVHPIVVLLLQKVQAFAVWVSQPPISQVGVSRSLHCQLWRTAPAGEIQREEVEVARQCSKRKRRVVCFQPRVVHTEDRYDAVVRSSFC